MRNKLWIRIGIGATIIIVLLFVASVLSIGEKLRNIHQYVEWGWYLFAIILLYFMIINPLIIVLFAPTFSIATEFDKNNNKTYRLYKKVAQIIIKNNELNEDEKKALLASKKNKEELKKNLNNVFNNTIKKEINKIIYKNATTVMISTTISQNGKLDMLTVLSVNMKMIKEIVLKCGFRPSYARLGKLATRIMTTALIADSLEGLDFNDIFPQSTANILSEVPLIKPLASSFINGMSNALLTLRVGVVTRKYLFTDQKEISQSEIRKTAIKESIKMIPGVIKDVLSFLPQKVAKLFTPKGKETQGE